MSSIIPFTFPETGQPVRTVTINGEPWFVAADVATVLELGNPRSSLALLDDDEKGVHTMDTLGGQQQMATVNEPGLYSLILRSRKPQARAFKRWVTHEVIPSIRRTGRYEAAPTPAFLVPTSFAEALELAARQTRELEASERRVAELEPVAHSWTTLASATGDYSLRDAAHILNRDPNITTGQNRLMRSLRELDMVDRRGIPYARHIGHLVERATSYEHPHTGESVLGRPQVRVTVAGLHYLHKRLGGVAPLRVDELPLRVVDGGVA